MGNSSSTLPSTSRNNGYTSSSLAKLSFNQSSDTSEEEVSQIIATSSKCPVKQDSTASPPPSSSSSSSKCPVKGETKQKYNVYSQPIDPTNQMPVNPNQFPHESQNQPLNTGRVKSSIPKGGGSDGETWTYPSEQMFFNALKRKDKGADAEEKDMHTIIAIHNNMNERTWNKVLEFEKTFHCKECPSPKLHKFIGKPHDLSIKARLKTWMGWPIPFDRHDWTVDRCGTPVRYIIDYYHDEEEENDIKPHLRSRTDVKSITVDVRPAALDSFTNFMDAVRMPFHQQFGTVADVYEDDVDETVVEMEGGTDIHENERYWEGIVQPKVHHDQVFQTMQTFREQCSSAAAELNKCTGEEDCARKTMVLDVCFGNIICPAKAAAFSNDPTEETYQPLTECIAKFRAEATR